MADVNTGKNVYTASCFSCHGASGQGDGPAAVALTPKPADLKQTKLTDEELKRIIQGGGQSVGRSPLMPPAPVVAQDLDNLVAYIRSLK